MTVLPSSTAPAPFHDRREAGRDLAARLERLRHEAPLVLAISRGGIPVAAEVAGALGAPLDVLVVHELGDGGHRIGAVSEDGLAIVDHDEARSLGIDAEQLALLRERAAAGAAAAARRLRGNRPPYDVVGRTVLLVDDGLGAGASAIAAAHTARRRGAGRIVLAVPVARAAALARLGEQLDEIVCVEVAPVERWYEHAPAVSDAEIAAALEGGERRGGRLRIPQAARGAVVLATPSETVRRTLAAMGFATLSLPPGADAQAVVSSMRQLRSNPATRRLAIGAFGLGATAEAVLAAAAESDMRAVVAAGGRPDHAAPRLPGVTAATLLIVGGEDRHVVRLARAAIGQLAGEHSVAVVPGATHELAEAGAREQVAHLAGTWYATHL